MVFYKMNGIGNDYVFVDTETNFVENPALLAKKISDRNFSVGSDGLVLLKPSVSADVKMEIYNADGSRAEMCGNAIRCVARYLYEVAMRGGEEYFVETDAGIKRIRIGLQDGRFAFAEAEMGIPRAEGAVTLRHKDRTYVAEKVNVGNPHAVIIPDEVPEKIEECGKCFSTSDAFPQGANIEFVRIIDRHRIAVKVYERGSGVTKACGTGATAAAFAAIEKGLADSPVTVVLEGGELEIRRAGQTYYMKGSAEISFVGETDATGFCGRCRAENGATLRRA